MLVNECRLATPASSTLLVPELEFVLSGTGSKTAFWALGRSTTANRCSCSCRFATMDRRSFFLVTNSIVLLLTMMTSLMATAAGVSVDGRYSFVMNASRAAAEADEYDYIVVGGGAAGCSLAATLSQKYKVVLLERGGAPYQRPEVTMATNFGSVLAAINDTNVSAAQGFQSLDGVMNRRGRVLGGGTSVNAGFYSRAEPEWIDERKMKWARVNESYAWVEAVMVSFPPLGPWQTAMRDGLLETGVGPDNGNSYDHLVGVKVGGTIFDSVGHRRTAADLLQYANPQNIVVYTFASVHQIEWELDGAKPKARGVVFTDENGKAHKALLSGRAGSELILSAGAMGTPQLMMLSGIGPADHLKDLDIPLVMNQPAIGQGMADNPCFSMLVPSQVPVEESLISVVGVLTSGFYIEGASGTSVAFNEIQALNVLDPEYRSDDFVALGVTLQSRVPATAFTAMSQAGVLVGKIASPASRGYLRLNTTDVKQNPLVRFNYFEDWRDLYACVEGIRVMVKLLQTSAYANITYPRLPESVMTWSGYVGPLAPNSTEAALLSQWCRSTVLTIWHFHGGALEGVVVDDSYKVLGVDALRIIDGSTFRSSPGTNPQSTVLMLGRYMGLEILDERARTNKS